MADVIDLISSSPPLTVSPKPLQSSPHCHTLNHNCKQFLNISSTKGSKATVSHAYLSDNNNYTGSDASRSESASSSLFIYDDTTPQDAVAAKRRRLSLSPSELLERSPSPAPLPPVRSPQWNQRPRESAATGLSITAKPSVTTTTTTTTTAAANTIGKFILKNGSHKSESVRGAPSLPASGAASSAKDSGGISRLQGRNKAAGGAGTAALIRGNRSDFLTSLSCMLENENYDIISSSSPFVSSRIVSGAGNDEREKTMASDAGGSTAIRAKKRYDWDGEMSDPIVLTSPVPESMKTHDSKHRKILKKLPSRTPPAMVVIDSDEVDSLADDADLATDIRINENLVDSFALSDDILESLLESTKHDPKSQSLSGRTSTLLANLSTRGGSSTSLCGDESMIVAAPSSQKTVARRKVTSGGAIDDIPEDDIVPEPQNTSNHNRRVKLTAAEREAKAREREAAKAQRTREKEEEKERKRLDREAKAEEKRKATNIVEANKLKVDKKVSTPEMLLDLATSFIDTSLGHSTTEFMRELGVDTSFFESTIPNVIKWRRKVKATYDEAAGYWKSCPLRISSEKHVLCLLTAQEFVDMVLARTVGLESDGPETLELHVLRMRSVYPSYKIIYMIEGLAKWKRQNSRNKAYQAEVRRHMELSGLGGGESSRELAASSQSRRKKTASKKPDDQPPVDPDLIEDALLQLQVFHNCLIQHTNIPAESAEWIKIFTQHISTIPYREERMNMNDSAFCMDVGQVRAGDGAADTFVKMLQEVNRVTEPMAYGIAAYYPSVTDLLRGMKEHGPGMLEDVKKTANKSGTLTGSRIGPAVSRRLYKVFMGQDPGSTDI